MAILPVFCDNCRAIWGATNVIGGTGAQGLTLTNVAVGPCPKCGGTGHVPDGVYDLIDDTLRVVAAAGLPAPTLRSIIAALELAARGDATPAQVMETVERQAPPLAPIVNVYLQKPDKLRWIMLLIAVLGILMQGPTTVQGVSQILRDDPVIGPNRVRQRPVHSGKSTARPKRPPKTHGRNKKRPRKRR